MAIVGQILRALKTDFDLSTSGDIPKKPNTSKVFAFLIPQARGMPFECPAVFQSDFTMIFFIGVIVKFPNPFHEGLWSFHTFADGQQKRMIKRSDLVIGQMIWGTWICESPYFQKPPIARYDLSCAIHDKNSFECLVVYGAIKRQFKLAGLFSLNSFSYVRT